MNARGFELFSVGLAFDQHFDCSANKGFGYLHSNLVLRSHGLRAPLFPHSVSDLASHLVCASAFLLRVCKNAESLKSRFANEIEQGFEAGLCLAWETDNEGGPQ